MKVKRSLGALAGLLFLASLGIIPHAAAAPATTPADQPTSGSVPEEVRAVDPPASAPAPQFDLDLLLADPVAAKPRFQYLIDRRSWLARQGGSVEAFEQVAADFARRGAHYSALELLWFAERIVSDPERRQRLTDRMRELSALTTAAEAKVEIASQLWSAGKPTEAIAYLRQIIGEQPYCERAHYELGFYFYQGYIIEEIRHEDLIEPLQRAKIFRVCYEQFMITLAIDPLYDDGYYYLNLIRGILPDYQALLNRTNDMSMRSLTFRSLVLPPMSKMEEGARDRPTLLAAAEGLEQVGLYAYAVYTIQAALAQEVGDATADAVLRKQIGKILKDHLAEKPAPSRPHPPATKGDQPKQPTRDGGDSSSN
jgi:hypothetical protein